MAFDPTPEQQQIIDAFLTGNDLVIEAGAGTGKTSTLRLLGEATPERKGVYIAYNRAIATDAKRSFPSNVECATAHSFAFRAVGYRYKHRISGGYMKMWEQAKLMGISNSFPVTSELSLSSTQIARVVINSIGNFCNSADSEIEGKHVFTVEGAEDNMGKLRQFIVPLARRAWEDIKDPQGRLPFQHDHYLKIWALGSPNLNADFILFDEAQDANPVIAGIVARQSGQKIMVGDSSQAIYGWRGAVDAMSSFDQNAQRLLLSQSFRFGDAVAAEANRWLGLLEAPLRLKGFDQIASEVTEIETPDAILCRTNAGALAQAIMYQAAGKKVAIVGGTKQIKAMAEAALEMMEGRQPWNPEFAAFDNWGDFKQHVEDDGDSNLKVFVRLVEEYGAEVIIDVAKNTVEDERKADIVVSTAHKAKGREWDRVKIATDFREPNKDEGQSLSRPEMMLAYVAVTRAKQLLDNAGLAWIANWA